jgi:hypothetical protein
MLAALLPYAFAAAGAFALSVIVASLRDAIPHMRALARQIERIN